MYVKMLDGQQAGKIVDLRNDVALQFLRDGRADHAFRDPSPLVDFSARGIPVDTVLVQVGETPLSTAMPAAMAKKLDKALPKKARR